MGANIWFWLIYVIVLVFGVWGVGPWTAEPNPYRTFGSWIVLFILIGLLGWHDFGSPIR
jgi:hypothetical protein